ncbi:MAG: acetyl-CoA carboxylase biotin carboxyl carrier protein [Phycisphaerae bacterium]|jgi:acetyl-CoA carboxylase biotin carboxyl carrier protein|nr:acetyl-CoA carboxylase biotin carboxyl carrier protein [Phycisphaerae bacterium]HOO16400.1 acetyl-CoA carboxylase biotin carboxyl carrier protein [Phycisphaerae bacterium]HPC22028.1 acetyl-CoA carboxylase biotin carboxyl carrier protein [Phycisphaerae bacterium]HRS28751.1 acetyl-CoA carboxylase biotin carboxyl carrier protein [Phycisphaerae bacterium]HRT42091.1 acetyl-CoA carboxylase biotin carboxyl carrier protein [Phycisphaerae bacterium]
MDINQLKNLVQLMVENDLTRVELREGETHILLRRGFPPVVAAAGGMVAQPTVGAVPSAAPSQVLPTSGEEASNSPPADPDEYLIRSPMVGTFYAQHDPESPPFVNVGDEVGPDTVVCLVEAMKVFNEIKAEVSGRITKVLVKNAQAVEFDQPLFAVSLAHE